MDPRQVTFSQAGQALPCITGRVNRPLHERSLIVLPQATEILLDAHRINRLPISNPEMDNLVVSREWPRIVRAIDEVPDGTILLTSTYQPDTGPPILRRALDELRHRFNFELLESAADGLQVVRLHSRR